MVGFDEVDDLLWDVVLLCNLHTIFHVIDDDTGTLFERKSRMGVHPRCLIFGKKSGIYHLSHVVIERAGSYQRSIRPEFTCRGHCEVGYLQRVLKSARCFLGELFQKRLVYIRELYQRYPRDKTKRPLNQVHQRIGEQDENEVDQEVNKHYPVSFCHASLLIHYQPNIDHDIGKKNEKRTLDKLRALGELF